MTIAGQKDDKLVHMVRVYITENKEDTKDWKEEPQEPFPQDCCGQSCRPCVWTILSSTKSLQAFDIHHDDVVRWAKECAKRMPYEGSTLYSHFYEGDNYTEDNSVELVFSRSGYRPFELLDIRPLSHDTNLYKFAISHGKLNLPIGSHLRTRDQDQFWDSMMLTMIG